MDVARVTCVMALRATALALLAMRRPARRSRPAAEQTTAQKLFRKRLLNDRGVKPEVKRVLRHGGFVDRDIRFGDITGDGKSDAVVLVNEGGSAGRIALFVYSSHRQPNDNGGGGERTADPLQEPEPLPRPGEPQGDELGAAAAARSCTARPSTTRATS